MDKKIKLKLISKSREASPPPSDNPQDRGEIDKIEFITEAAMIVRGGRVELSYEENALSGLEGSSVFLIYDRDTPDTLTMIRSGGASVSMVFSPGLRHTCRYDNRVLPFDLTLMTHSLKNALDTGGELEVDYTIELPGGGIRTHLKIAIQDITENEEETDI